MEKELLISKDGPIITLTINRPAKMNALTPECLLEMVDILDQQAQARLSQPVVIRGAGDKAFCSGYDLGALPAGNSPEKEEEPSPQEKALDAIQRYPYPVLAMLNGFAYGAGCELAVACDLRIASEHIKMGMPPAKLGLVYPYSGYRRFLTVLGLPRTLEIFLTGKYYDSQSCLQIGLVHYLKPQQELESFTYELAGDLAKNSPLSLRGSKYALYKIAENRVVPPDDEQRIRSLHRQSLQSEDLREGKRALREKREPKFRGC